MTDNRIVVGLVDANGCGGSQIPGQDWIANFEFQAWRDENGLIHNKKLSLRWAVSDESLRGFMKRIKPYQVIRLSLMVKDETSAELIELLDDNITTDEELSQIAIELQKPVTFEHQRFGTFTLDRRFNVYNTVTYWDGIEVDLELDASEQEDLDIALKYAESMWDNSSSWNQRVLDFAVQELLADVWLEENDKPLSPDEFKSRLTLISICISPDGEFDFWFNDGNLFWGHSIVIVGNFQNGLTDAQLAG